MRVASILRASARGLPDARPLSHAGPVRGQGERVSGTAGHARSDSWRFLRTSTSARIRLHRRISTKTRRCERCFSTVSPTRQRNFHRQGPQTSATTGKVNRPFVAGRSAITASTLAALGGDPCCSNTPSSTRRAPASSASRPPGSVLTALSCGSKGQSTSRGLSVADIGSPYGEGFSYKLRADVVPIQYSRPCIFLTSGGEAETRAVELQDLGSKPCSMANRVASAVVCRPNLLMTL